MVPANKIMSLEQIADKIEILMKPQTDEKHITFELKREYDRPLVVRDELRLSQVLLNIVGNALKFTPENGKITVSIKKIYEDKNAVRIKFNIKDTGIGISKENQKKYSLHFNRYQTTKLQNMEEPDLVLR